MQTQQQVPQIGETSDFQPHHILQVELSQPLPDVSAVNPANGRAYTRAISLVRLHTKPIGMVVFPIPADGLTAEQYAQIIWEELRGQINNFLQSQSLPLVRALGAEGLPAPVTPRFIREREEFLLNAPFVSVIIPTRDRPTMLEPTLRTLLEVEYPNFEILIVDNAPATSATADLVQQHFLKDSRVRYFREDRPGVEWARNRGIINARGEYIAFTDDDVLVDRYWLAELMKGFTVIDDVGCVTGPALAAEMEAPSQMWFEEYSGFNRGFARRIYDMGENRANEFLYPYVAGKLGSGVNMAFRASVLREVGGFDPTLGTGSVARGGGDVAMYLRIVTGGWRLVYEPSALLYHFHRRDYLKLRNQIYSYGVGFTAMLLKTLVDNPRLIPDFALRVPYGLMVLLSNKSSKNRKRSAGYPKELSWLELVGMVYGPLAYVRSRRNVQLLKQKYGPLDVRTAGIVAEK